MPVLRFAVSVGIGLALLALGYYVGREIGRLEPVREDLRKARNQRGDD